MDIRVLFPGGKRVNALFDGYTVASDQPASGGGTGTAPAPFDIFLASLATCAGFYVLAFCEARSITTEGIELVQRHTFEEATHRLTHVELDIVLPQGFPEKYRSAVVKAAETCKVRKALLSPPEVTVKATVLLT